ncbi:hypothetical protein ACVWZZ_006122 [Bradyrhizobium sp. LM6.10]
MPAAATSTQPRTRAKSSAAASRRLASIPSSRMARLRLISRAPASTARAIATARPSMPAKGAFVSANSGRCISRQPGHRPGTGASARAPSNPMTKVPCSHAPFGLASQSSPPRRTGARASTPDKAAASNGPSMTATVRTGLALSMPKGMAVFTHPQIAQNQDTSAWRMSAKPREVRLLRWIAVQRQSSRRDADVAYGAIRRHKASISKTGIYRTNIDWPSSCPGGPGRR